jgi:hypothetical protein
LRRGFCVVAAEGVGKVEGVKEVELDDDEAVLVRWRSGGSSCGIDMVGGVDMVSVLESVEDMVSAV